MPVSKLFNGSLLANPSIQYQTRLRKLGVDIAKTMEKRFPRLKEIGVDIAIDENLKPWILEVNTLPDPFLFRKLSDRVFKRIYSYAVAYGRYSVRRRKK